MRVTDTDLPEIDLDDAPSSAELQAVAARIVTAAFNKAIDPAVTDEEISARGEASSLMRVCAAKIREMAGYIRRRDIAVVDGDIGQVDALTERIALVMSTFTEVEQELVEAALDAEDDEPLTAPTVAGDGSDDDDGAGGDLFEVTHPGLGRVVLSEASHSQLDKLIEDLNLESVDDDGDRVLAAAVDDDGEPVNLVNLNSPDKRAAVEAAIIEQAGNAGE